MEPQVPSNFYKQLMSRWSPKPLPLRPSKSFAKKVHPERDWEEFPDQFGNVCRPGDFMLCALGGTFAVGQLMTIKRLMGDREIRIELFDRDEKRMISAPSCSWRIALLYPSSRFYRVADKPRTRTLSYVSAIAAPDFLSTLDDILEHMYYEDTSGWDSPF